MHKLNDSDLQFRLDFCHEEASRIAGDPHHLLNLLHTDEDNFHVSGAINKQNFRYWSDVNPHWVTYEPLHSPKVIVGWCRYRSRLWPIFLQRHREWRALPGHAEELVPAPTEQSTKKHHSFHARWRSIAIVKLTANFPNRWMGRGSSNMPWPPRSSDLSVGLH